jgi:hypothetical protein
MLGDKYLDGEEVAKELGIAISGQELRLHGEKTDRGMVLNTEPIQDVATVNTKG